MVTEKTSGMTILTLIEKRYMRLPLGAVKAKGWLQEMLVRQKEGATGHMDTLYPQVMGERNGWLGGDGDQWECGPYWIDGLLPLAYLLDDNELKAKVQPWVEWALDSQREDGNFGPHIDYGPERGIQRDNSLDWWPRMVMLKILQQYYSATGDQRINEMAGPLLNEHTESRLPYQEVTLVPYGCTVLRVSQFPVLRCN